jgi:hypothetical protein
MAVGVETTGRGELAHGEVAAEDGQVLEEGDRLLVEEGQRPVPSGADE